MAQQYFTIPSTGVYGTYKFYENDLIPMELAVELGIEGAALTEPEVLSDTMKAAIAADLADPTSASRAQVEAAIAERGALFLDDVAEPFPGFFAVGQVTFVAQTAYLILVRVDQPKTVTKLSVYTTATGTNFDLAILDDTYAKLRGISAPVASVANGLTTGTLTASFTYEPGVDYYHTFVADATTTGVRGPGTAMSAILNVGSVGRSLSKLVSQNTIPNPVTTPAGASFAPWIGGHN